MRVKILGVEIDKISLNQSLEIIENWLTKDGQHYVVTPNLEFILDAQKDEEFRRVLNKADLSIPDSSRIGWILHFYHQTNILKRLITFPLILIPRVYRFDTIAGTDLMEALIKRANEKGFTIGFLGGGKGVANRVSERLRKKYQKLKVGYIDNGGVINKQGDWVEGNRLTFSKVDILFVAFGHIKQEKWIAKNLSKLPVKIAIGVGGAFDYFSGDVLRAPGLIRELGFEWLFRLISQPWRIKRQFKLAKFLFKFVVHSNHGSYQKS